MPCACVCAHVDVCGCVHVPASCVRVHMRVWASVWAGARVGVHACVRTGARAWAHVCMCVRVCACVFTRAM